MQVFAQQGLQQELGRVAFETRPGAMQVAAQQGFQPGFVLVFVTEVLRRNACCRSTGIATASLRAIPVITSHPARPHV